jgi:hypothetical protein
VPFVINKKDLGEYMKILFAGEWYYPSGGIGDFIMVGTEQECLAKYQEMAMMYLQGSTHYGCDWGQIADHDTMKQEISLSFDLPRFNGLSAKTGTITIEKMIDGSLETISLTSEDL